MNRRLKMHRCNRLALLAALLAAAGCGSSGNEETAAPSASPVSPVRPVDEPAPRTSALPSRPIAFERFALEGAVRSPLSEPDGVDGERSTTWALRGDGIELRMEVWTWFSPAEAQMQCWLAAGDGAAPSLALGSPTWTTRESVYLTQDAACVLVTVLRGRDRDPLTAMAVAALLIESAPATPEPI